MTDINTTETRTERWRYLGRRELSKGGLGACYEMPNGDIALFRERRPPAVIGGIYEVKVSGGEGETLTMVGSARFAEAPSSADPQVGGLESQDRAAVTADALRKLEQRARAESPERFGTVTLAELRALYLRSPHPRRAALLAQAIRHITAS